MHCFQVNFHECQQGYNPSYSYVIVSWLRWWIPQMTCGKLFLQLSYTEQKKNLFWRLPSWVNLLSLFLVLGNKDVSVWFNIMGMQIEIRVEYQGWSLYIKKMTLTSFLQSPFIILCKDLFLVSNAKLKWGSCQSSIYGFGQKES